MIDLNKIPKAVINIKERTERLSQFLKEIDSFFLNKDITVIEAEVGKPSRIFIAKSHKKAIQWAKDNNYDYVLIMEDDLRLQPNSFEYAQECFSNLPSNWDILLGGIYTTGGLKEENKYWNKTSTFSALHFYIVHKDAYDKILNMKSDFHIDGWLARDKHLGGGQLNCYVVKELFALQYNGFSDNVGRIVNYDNLLTKFKIYKNEKEKE